MRKFSLNKKTMQVYIKSLNTGTNFVNGHKLKIWIDY